MTARHSNRGPDGKPDFGPGDLVVCVDDGPHVIAGVMPRDSRRGMVLRVGEISPPKNPRWSGWGFREVGRQSGGWRACYRFRKIDKADESFTAQIHACKPVSRKVTA